MKILKILKIAFVVCFALQAGTVLILATTPLAAQAGLFTDPKAIDFRPQVSIPNSIFTTTGAVSSGSADEDGKFQSNLLANYIKAIYDYGLAISGILAAIVLMAGGVLWLTSAGNDTKITQAKELISGSVIGIIILSGSWIILNTINPNLWKLKEISVTGIAKRTYCCDPDKGLVPAGEDGTCVLGESCPIDKNCQQVNTSYKCVKQDIVCCEYPGIRYKTCLNDISPSECDKWHRSNTKFFGGSEFFTCTPHEGCIATTVLDWE
ncbi:TPA: hypothetical protein DCZ15_01995 [Candidatus Falkowbacteria bacterium]|nr:MAG: hypothetical protein UV95_C0001G0207 [Candidatus Falkowbacteria bacterium GW2011_GWF2_43_32]HBA36626.1 hypothetical protein [Candidatus Falkowbacteria bacterium]